MINVTPHSTSISPGLMHAMESYARHLDGVNFPAANKAQLREAAGLAPAMSSSNIAMEPRHVVSHVVETPTAKAPVATTKITAQPQPVARPSSLAQRALWGEQ